LQLRTGDPTQFSAQFSDAHPSHDNQDVLCVEFLRNGAVVSGMPDGEVYYWLPSDTEDMGLEVRNSDAILRNSVAIL
jgi:hypothetical protein